MSDESYEITFQRSELIPGGNGALLAFSEDFPDRQFLFIPAVGGVGEQP